MDYQCFHLEERENRRILLVFLDNPKVNALSRQLIEELQKIVHQIKRSSYRVVIVTNLGRIFCAGADLKERQLMKDDEIVHFVTQVRNLFFEIYKLPIPTICAMQGSALGGGLELALACDYRIGAKEGEYGLPETSLGIIPGAGGTQYLLKLLGPAKAKDLIFSARRLKGLEAFQWGVLDQVVAQDDVLSTVLDKANEWLQNAPLALRYAKNALNEGTQLTAANMEIEKKWYDLIVSSEDRLEALNAFREKRKPFWKGK